jgi:hypothetical protein
MKSAVIIFRGNEARQTFKLFQNEPVILKCTCLACDIKKQSCTKSALVSTVCMFPVGHICPLVANSLKNKNSFNLECVFILLVSQLMVYYITFSILQISSILKCKLATFSRRSEQTDIK